MNLYDPQLLKSALDDAAPVSVPGSDHVAIVMAIKNGERWLEAQLKSLLAQQHRDWSLVIGDDRSTDQSADVVHDFANRNPHVSVRLWPGPNRGFQSNFLALLARVPRSARYVAFADQDDVWHPTKLTRAIQALKTTPKSQPALYCGRTEIADSALNAIGVSPEFPRQPTFENALVQSLAGGNTMVFNRAALDILVQAHDPERPPVSHDWWAYQVISGAGGHVMFDPKPQVIYRQHGQNLVGSGLGFLAKGRRLHRLLAGDFRQYSDVNLRALDAARPFLTPGAIRSLDQFREGRANTFVKRIRAFARAGIYRQTLSGTIALWAAAILNRI